MRGLWPWLRLLAALAVITLLAVRLGTDAVLDGLRAVSAPAAFAALGLGLLTTVACAYRWRLVARGLGLPLTLGQAVGDYYRGLLLNSVLPAGILGDLHRALSHGRQSGDLGKGVRAVVLERFAGQAVLITIGLGVLATTSVPGLDLGPTLLWLVPLLAVALLLPPVRRVLTRTLTDARALATRDTLPGVLGLSAAAVAGHVLLFLLAAHLAGVRAGVLELVPLAVLTLLVMAVPVNVGGFGPREAFLAVAFGAAGFGAEQGLTTGVVYGVLALVSALPGILPLLLPQRGEGQPERLDQPREHVLALAR
ncbi:uncharacterized membrane protein YbhN (UPF0104 family) [Crossiella equi]|uniref:Uncharacterized membrane protein YbhN (UPF0104 family) n=1 Tax=Crossiella equi TaxID=130796 RepID=A0ABS5AQ72_9PSEU|nr:lysylphosphatidylglycerol synthase transmembrane domain-containing protein [Crossiella equi]MBP2478717.1 uncharacterized membrane protein YbhN (UPF0104 family) [Crossiella equi]